MTNTLGHELGHNFGSVNVKLVIFIRFEQEHTSSESTVAEVISQEKSCTLL